MEIAVIKKYALDFLDPLRQKWRTRYEFQKFEDPRRKAIWQNVHLTEEQRGQIDKLYMENYGKKIPYTWHRHYTAYTKKFDPQYFPEFLFHPKFEYFMNAGNTYAEVLTDKNFIPLLAQKGHVRMPHTYLSCTAGLLQDSDGQVLSSAEACRLLADIGSAFIKPAVGTNSGTGCAVVNFSNGRDSVSQKSVGDILAGYGSDYVVQEKIICHPQVAKLHPSSCNTFRIISYRWGDKFYTTPIVMRIGRKGSFLDNAHAGGIFVAVDDDGTLHDTAFSEFHESFTAHPDTGVVFHGCHIDGFDGCVQAALRLHSLIPQIGVINWDFTLDVSGMPLLIEANTFDGGIWIVEMAHGKGPFGDRTAAVLRWIALMETLPLSQRKNYRFGKMK